MRSKSLIGIALSGLLFIPAGPALAAFDAFLKIEGIPGEAADASHREWIHVSSFDTAITRSDARTAPSTSGFQIRKAIDKSSPLLMRACATGENLPEVQIEFVRRQSGNQLLFYQVTLENVRITSYQTAVNSGGETTGEDMIVLFAERFSWTYRLFDSTGDEAGTLKMFWDFVRNEGGLEELEASFHVSAERQGDAIVLSWPAQAGSTYRVLAADSVDGSYSGVQTVTAETTGTMVQKFPVEGAARFFVVERQ